MLNRSIKHSLVFIGGLAIGYAGLPQEPLAQRFAGKTIEIIVPGGAGGGLTRNARRFIKHFPNHIPGKPKIIIKNVVGGGGQKGPNLIYKKGKKDGTQILWGPMNFVGINLGLPGIRYVPSKFKILGASGGYPYVTIVRKDIKGGINTREDIIKKSGFVTGGRIPGGNLGLYSRFSFSMLGIENKFVIGYKSQPKLKAAMIQNEIQALTTGNPGYFAFYVNDTLKKGQGIALFQHPGFDMKGNPRKPTHIKGVPYFMDFYRKVKGGVPSGDAYEAYKWFSMYQNFSSWMVMNPGTPDNITSTLQKAFTDNWNDPATVALYKKGNKVRPVVLSGEEALALASNFNTMTEGAKRYYQEQFGIAKASRKKKK